LNQGFQWLDGSFAEQIELLEGRPPKDIDVVSFPLCQPKPAHAAQAAELFILKNAVGLAISRFSLPSSCSLIQAA
jgi:hypothetical protein